ncbi:taurine ABC transporter substrate-binding protein, partial [Klebsiella pneumoniae]|nr:taurine ABC transporter substrate-binding protein [Klebsiella pneumoniae]
AVKSLQATAEFLKEQKTLQAILPDYSVGVTDQYVKAIAAGK